MTIIEYNSRDDITVKFENGNKKHTSWQLFNKGRVKNVYDKIIYGVGYIGEGEYRVNINKKQSKQYSRWFAMLRRCYCKEYHQKRPTYSDCIVTEEWHNFQNFAKWYDKNYYEIEGADMHLDKDILVKGNKIYSSETCIFVPYFINYLFVKRDASRGELPIGVSYVKNKRKYAAMCSETLKGKRRTINIGEYDTPAEAFASYKRYKELQIKSVANKYKDKIPSKLYEAMIAYEVDISD